MDFIIRFTLSCLITIVVLAQHAMAEAIVMLERPTVRTSEADHAADKVKAAVDTLQAGNAELIEASREMEKLKAAMDRSPTRSTAHMVQMKTAATNALAGATQTKKDLDEKIKALRAEVGALKVHSDNWKSYMENDETGDPETMKKATDLERDVATLKDREAALIDEAAKLDKEIKNLKVTTKTAEKGLNEMGRGDDDDPSREKSPPSPASDRAPKPSNQASGGDKQPPAEKKSAQNDSSGGSSPSMPSLPSMPQAQPTNLAMPSQLSPPAGACPPDQPNCQLCMANPRAPGCPGQLEPQQAAEAVKQDQDRKAGGDETAGTSGGKSPLDLSHLYDQSGKPKGNLNGQLPTSGPAGVGSGRGIGDGRGNDPGVRPESTYGQPGTTAGGSGSYSGSGGAGGSGAAPPRYQPPTRNNPFNRIAEKTMGKAAFALSNARYARAVHEGMFNRYQRSPASAGMSSARLRADGVTGPHTNQFNKIRVRYSDLFAR